MKKLLILDGTAGESPVCRYIREAAPLTGATVSRFALGESRLAPCLGDFDCWTKTPGRCRTDDLAQDIAQGVHDADLVVFLTPLVFGGYAAPLKKAVDRLIPLIHSFFHSRDGVTRHLPRYDKYPALLCIGVADAPGEEARQLFSELAGGNAINLIAPYYRALVISPQEADWPLRVAEAVRAGLRRERGDPLPVPERDALARACAPDANFSAGRPPPKSACILIGSARPRGQSTSESLARGLAEGLEAAGIRSTLVPVIHFARNSPRAEKAMAALLSGELLVVAAPLYVDALPGLTTQTLERLAEELRGQAHNVRQVAGLLNCGYPEAMHNRSALRMLRLFAHESGLPWAGGLAMGAGEILHGKPLSRARIMLRAQIRALRRAAADLAAGHGISAEAAACMATPVIPAFLFRWAAPLRWLYQARPHGISWRQLHGQPLDATVSATYSEIAGFGRAKSH